ncbi:MAG: SMP-30/gluconolactonase/LRE family protein [Planctomycetaceae bacterium]|nr:SMP-30/gluconolactonase/LRE family protein [Planctomycetaceae bacterium]
MKQFLFLLLAMATWGLPESFAQDIPLSQILIPGEDWELVSAGYGFTEGPAADASGTVYFTDVPADKIHVIALDGQVTVFDDQAERTSGLYFGPGGDLYACRNGGRKIVVYRRQSDGQLNPQPEVLAEEVNVNDLVVDRWGGVYFTNPKESRLEYVAPSGYVRQVATGLNPNGIVLSADGGTLVTTERDQPWLWTFRAEAGGMLTSRSSYYGVVQLPSPEEKPKSDGMTFDDQGRLYLASEVGVQFFDPLGRQSGVIAKPQPAFLSNVVFGGPEFNLLYATCQDKVYRRKLNATGKPDWLPKPSESNN